MSRIQNVFADLKTKGETAFIPFITLGDPGLEWTERIVRDLERAGADIIELGIPYSDPLADGPVIQEAALRSLNQGTKLVDVFQLVAKLRQSGVAVPLILFTYVNPVLQFGVERFFAEAAKAGADGAIIPDLPHEESEEVRMAAVRHGIDLIPLVAPTSRQRIEKIAKDAAGFVYCVSSLGVTGMRSELSAELPEFVAGVRSATPLPVAVGFGVSTPEQAAQIKRYADGVIVGSALVRKVKPLADAVAAGNQAETEKAYAELIRFAASMKEPLRS
ncbi:tryptophan synthase subunit alpha [Effusibacillus lacus]|uniref:Tryptophan synthase alpha chain n=1 Tax=Effusibacillus lacus TaxID=1348429 RepID=A0A292YMX6_9BACL|nr:tryptophan synthase subunit alpha [Effusibacillus lacus]TCS75308.1 tryptophan synthase alpha chain [Effusibacillus lacus]GAX89744.1 tryptophan synthase subunit alpha [Effusibacillus lacus]